VEIEDAGEIEPTLAGVSIGDVGDSPPWCTPPVWRGAGSPWTDRPEALSYFSGRL